LRALLNGTPVPGKPGEPHSGRFTQPSRNPGVGTLLRGERKPAPAPPQPNANGPVANFNPLRPPWIVVKVVLLTADLLLLILASLLVLKSPGPLSFTEWVLCVFSFGVGSALALVAFLTNPPEQQAPAASALPATMRDDNSKADLPTLQTG